MKKLAIVYDWLDSWGGVERILVGLRRAFPDADFFTAHADYDKAPWAAELLATPTWMQQLPGFVRSSRLLSLPFYPYAFESLDLSGYQNVISITSSFAKGVITRPETKHICYLLTPTRYLWSHADVYLGNGLKHYFSLYPQRRFREWDYVAASRPDTIVSISKTVAERCIKYYGRSSEVLYPPFDTAYWNAYKNRVTDRQAITESVGAILPETYYLVVSRLETYKKIDHAIAACRAVNVPLVIVGSGRYERKLRSIADTNTLFLGKVSDKDLAGLYTHATALLMPQEEDFGYVSLEAQYFGCPVIAFGRGGVTETVSDGVTGLLYNSQTVQSLVDALAKYHTISYNIRRSTRVSGPSRCSEFAADAFISYWQRAVE